MIDLHMHSKYSDDGEFSPLSLVEQCRAQGVTLMSITDHNCVGAQAGAESEAKKRGISYISGIEIDCTFRCVNFHVLGYNIDYASPDFRDVEENIRKQGRRASLEMLEKTQALGFWVTEEELQSMCQDSHWPEAWTGEVFAEILLSKPEYKDHSLLLPYRKGGSRGDNPYVNIYWDLYSQGKPCHGTVSYPDMGEVIDIIHQNHGIAVLAHPCLNLKGNLELLEDIRKLGINGLEAYSSYHTPAQRDRMAAWARERGLLATCGSDFHGKTKPAISLGQHGGPEEICLQDNF